MATAEHTQHHSYDHTEAWTWVVDLLALLGAISPALIFVGYLLSR